ncbi:hypothetical protein GCM10027294_46110 [Marinactinospora endophytica]
METVLAGLARLDEETGHRRRVAGLRGAGTGGQGVADAVPAGGRRRGTHPARPERRRGVGDAQEGRDPFGAPASTQGSGRPGNNDIHESNLSILTFRPIIVTARAENGNRFSALVLSLTGKQPPVSTVGHGL